MPELETLVMCRRIERELALRRVERRARWEGLPRGRGWWWPFGCWPAVRMTGTVSALPALARRARRSVPVGGTER